jgi:hypothetical protein
MIFTLVFGGGGVKSQRALFCLIISRERIYPRTARYILAPPTYHASFCWILPTTVYPTALWSALSVGRLLLSQSRIRRFYFRDHYNAAASGMTSRGLAIQPERSRAGAPDHSAMLRCGSWIGSTNRHTAVRRSRPIPPRPALGKAEALSTAGGLGGFRPGARIDPTGSTRRRCSPTVTTQSNASNGKIPPRAAL